VSPSLSGILVSARSDGAHFSYEVPTAEDFFYSLNDLEFSGEHRGSAATEVIVRCNSWLDSSSKKPSADRNDKESYRQRRQFLPV
jgi:hypothetical protein